MAGWDEEAESSIKLAYEAAEALQKTDPKHKLLEYIFVPEGQETSPEIEEAMAIKMKNRFWGREKPWQNEPGAKVVAVVMGNYASTVRIAIASM